MIKLRAFVVYFVNIPISKAEAMQIILVIDRKIVPISHAHVSSHWRTTLFVCFLSN